MTLIRALLNKEADERIDGLMAIERALRSLMDQRMRPHGLTYAQFALLRFVHQPRDAEGVTTTRAARAVDIAAYFGFATRTVTVTLNGLEAAGLITRERSKTDGRVWSLALTPPGFNALDKATAEYAKTRQNVFERLPRRHWNALWHVIPSVLLNIESEHRKLALKKRE